MAIVTTSAAISFSQATTLGISNIYSVEDFLLKPDYIPDDGYFFRVAYTVDNFAHFKPHTTHIWIPLYPGTTLDTSLSWMKRGTKYILGVIDNYQPEVYQCDAYKLVVGDALTSENLHDLYCEQFYNKLFENIASLAVQGLIKGDTPYHETPAFICSHFTGFTESNASPYKCKDNLNMHFISRYPDLIRTRIQTYFPTICSGIKFGKKKYAVAFDAMNTAVNGTIEGICSSVRSFLGWTSPM